MKRVHNRQLARIGAGCVNKFAPCYQVAFVYMESKTEAASCSNRRHANPRRYIERAALGAVAQAADASAALTC